jgi:DNA-binding transcriptional LysR family regulator
LETALDAQLLVRRTNGCGLTGEGEAFLLHAERMEAEMLAAQATLGRTDSAISGTVRIGAPDGFGVSFLAPRLGALTARHPDLRLQLVPVPRSFSLPQREADIAITVERPAEGRLVARKLVDYSLSLYASRSYLEAHGMPTRTEDLKEHRLISYVEDLIFSPSLQFTREILRNWTAHSSRFPAPPARPKPCVPARASPCCMIISPGSIQALCVCCPSTASSAPIT